MFVELKKDQDIVCKTHIGFLGLSGINVYKFEIINKELLPFPISSDNRLNKINFKRWMENRIVPNFEPQLDQMLGAFMAYLLSSCDDYWVNPSFPQLLTYGMVDPYWVQGYICEPCENIESAKIKATKFKQCLRNPY